MTQQAQRSTLSLYSEMLELYHLTTAVSKMLVNAGDTELYLLSMVSGKLETLAEYFEETEEPAAM